MNTITGIILFAILLTLALTIVSLANRVQTRKRVIRLKVKQLRTRINELEDIYSAITPLLESTQVSKLINQEIIDLIQGVNRLDSSTIELLSLNLTTAESHSRVLAGGINPQEVQRIQPSDSAIAKHQYFLGEAGKLVRRHHSLGLIQESEMKAYIQELSWAHLMVAVTSQIAQGHKAMTKNDPMVAQGHYRNAQHLLQNTQTKDERRQRFIRELSEIISGKRLSISEELMPEAEFNPPPKPNTDTRET